MKKNLQRKVNYRLASDFSKITWMQGNGIEQHFKKLKEKTNCPSSFKVIDSRNAEHMGSGRHWRVNFTNQKSSV